MPRYSDIPTDAQMSGMSYHAGDAALMN